MCCMKIFLDTANVESVQRWASTGLIDGVTTNPTHLSKEENNPTNQVLALCAALPQGLISVEVIEAEPEAVYSQAKKIAQLSENVIVKIPCYYQYYTVIKRLVNEGVVLNITLVFTIAQALMMAKLNVAYVSPFVGRLDDTGADGLQLIEQLAYLMDYYRFTTQVLAASIRDVHHFEGALMAGADIVTLPVAVFEQSLNHDLTDKGMLQFASDWNVLKVKNFP